MSRIWLIISCILINRAVFAAEKSTDATTQSKAMPSKEIKAADIKIPSPWAGKVELGYLEHSGNTSRATVNSKIAGSYTSGRHRTQASWKYYHLRRQVYSNKRQSTYTLQSDYKLGPKMYIYTGFKGVDSSYSAYYKDHTLSFGLGTQVTNTDRLLLELEAGPGYRYQKPNIDEIDDSDVVFPVIVKEPIFRGNVRTEWNILPNLQLYTDITLISGSSNTNITADFGLTNKMTDNVAFKISQSEEYYNKVPEGLKKHDGLFTVSVLVSY